MPTAEAKKPITKTQTARQTAAASPKKAVIASGGRQYIVHEDEELEIERLAANQPTSFTPLLIIDGEKVNIGAPAVVGAKVEFQITESEVKADKVVAIRYKSKKRVRKVRGHRQRLIRIKITKIS